MTLAAMLGIGFLAFAPATPGFAVLHAQQAPAVTVTESSAAQEQTSPAASQAQPPEQKTEPAATPAPPTTQTPKSPAKPHRRHQKPTPDCSTAATTPNPGGADPAASTQGGVTSGTPANGSSGGGSAGTKPCPPPKVVVRDGGTAEPTVKLKGGSSAEQASQQRFTTDQLAQATDANLKKIAELSLTASQQEIVGQIKQFMEQSKAALAAGDLERGHNLAMKAHLLSDELLKP